MRKSKIVLNCCAVVLSIVLLSCSSDSKSASKDVSSQSDPVFLQGIKALKSGETGSFQIKNLGFVNTIYPFSDTSDIEWRDIEEHPEYRLDLRKAAAIKSEHILDISPEYILIAFPITNSLEWRAATFSPEGKPIENILIAYSRGNNEYTISRGTNTDIDPPYKYNASNSMFTFIDQRMDMEWEVFPTKGKRVITYSLPRKVKITKSGSIQAIAVPPL